MARPISRGKRAINRYKARLNREVEKGKEIYARRMAADTALHLQERGLGENDGIIRRDVAKTMLKRYGVSAEYLSLALREALKPLPAGI